VEEKKTTNSNSPKGHGPGKQVKPGANICPKSWWKGAGGKGDPLKQNIRRKG
tara:strand:+ start:252 stop:407 length:156 start_codon:yes stop_codon:yes gene_type:complete